MSEPTERELQEYAERLARFRAISAPSGMRSELRDALLAAPVAFGPAPRPSWVMRLRPALAVLVVFAILAGGAGSAAAGSLPGDAAFGLKRAVENVQVAIAPDDTARLDLLVAHTDRRLTELETLASRRSSAVGVATDEYVLALDRLEQMLATVSAEPATSSRDAAIERARAAAAAHVTRLEALAGTLPDAAQPGIQRAIEAGQGIRGGSAPSPSRSPEPSRPTGVPGGVPGGVPSAPGGHTTVPPTRPATPSAVPTRR